VGKRAIGLLFTPVPVFTGLRFLAGVQVDVVGVEFG
jgi:hypothetical protein